MQKTIGFIAGGLAVIGVSGCDGVAINPPIKDGCYYLKDAPIVKIEGSEAKFLAPGTIKRATVERQGLSRGEHIYVAKFTPGFVVPTCG